ncbi:MAG: hypothetical protein EAZ55_01240 [Cytophagales bacterium]|nr:MAG: hypothetical protein EAZ55_01240 [Cytophagales bacterium]
MSFISNYIFDYKNKKASKKPQKRHTTTYQEAKNIGILFYIPENDETQAQTLNNWVAYLREQGKVVKTLTFLDINTQTNPYNFQFDYFTKKDISVLGNINSEKVETFIEQNFDYLFCIFLECLPPFENILLRSQAKCRVGKHIETKEDCLEFMIQLPTEQNNIKYLIESIDIYMEKIKN